MNKNVWGGASPAPRKDPYNKQDTRVEYQVFSNEYFSGADMHIYFGDIWVDEITSIDFTLQEDIMPLYGYNSFTYDYMARGKRIVQGQFAMNFKSTGYLQQILENADAIEYALKTGKNGKVLDPKFYDKYKLDEILKMYGVDSFDQVATQYEEAIWGETKDEEFNYINPSNRPFFQRNNPFGFDIRIHYGAVSEKYDYDKKQVYGNKSGQLIAPDLTVETINGVQIMLMNKRASTADQGMPVQETYSFMARDINGSSIKA